MESKHLLDWLRDAHAMEVEAEQMLGARIQRLERYPILQKRLEEHLDETKGQIKKLEHCMGLLGSDDSTLEDAGAPPAVSSHILSATMENEDVVKCSIAAYAFEHFEIASYKAIVKAADHAKEAEISQICRESLEEEVAMAKWLKEHFDETTRVFLERSQDGTLNATE
ncbi:ferritin-like domain-containing protein [Halomonas sp. GD1P12]|uniref:ferritin-like domain-containing protein n=1 Tax=Halomonas sp. GD1P12 TaxID=2982691 RepID=UPI0021E5165F|nr:ferritin-like domain-containing protein [Halomonas sp. GD1P12]UYG00440.1 ferritin-like domain-containing protein [Halomonas sp. GD1P12]